MGGSLIASPAWADRPEASYTNHYIKSVIQPAAVHRGGIFKHILHFRIHADLLLLLTNHITVRLTDPNHQYNQTNAVLKINITTLIFRDFNCQQGMSFCPQNISALDCECYVKCCVTRLVEVGVVS